MAQGKIACLRANVRAKSQGGEARTQKNSRKLIAILAHRFLEGFSWLELRALAGRDPDLLAGLWVPAGSGLTVCHGEGAKAWKGYPVTVLIAYRKTGTSEGSVLDDSSRDT